MKFLDIRFGHLQSILCHTLVSPYHFREVTKMVLSWTRLGHFSAQM
nr:MAG TPA: hypothetical protein [Caudoviricetes sp.]